VLGLSVLPASADSLCPSGDTFAQIKALGTCFIGNLDFSNFTYSSSASSPPAPIPATSVVVDTVNNASGIGFLFNSSWTAVGANEFSDALIGFTVTVIGGGPATLNDAALVQTGSIDSTNTGSVDSVGEHGCPGTSLATCAAGSEWALITSQTSNTVAGAAHTFYTPTGQLTVSKDINATTGTSPNAFASISGVEDTFSQATPEPRALAMLLGLALLGGLTLKRKLQNV
jgi:hypothetical protein